jgi:hypothetical protein
VLLQYLQNLRQEHVAPQPLQPAPPRTVENVTASMLALEEPRQPRALLLQQRLAAVEVEQQGGKRSFASLEATGDGWCGS